LSYTRVGQAGCGPATALQILAQAGLRVPSKR